MGENGTLSENFSQDNATYSNISQEWDLKQLFLRIDSWTLSTFCLIEFFMNIWAITILYLHVPKSSTDYLLIGLSAALPLVNAHIVFTTFVQEFADPLHLLGILASIAYLFVAFFLMGVSNVMTAVIAMERIYAVYYPYRFRSYASSKVALVLTVLVYAVNATSLQIPYLLGYPNVPLFICLSLSCFSCTVVCISNTTVIIGLKGRYQVLINSAPLQARHQLIREKRWTNTIVKMTFLYAAYSVSSIVVLAVGLNRKLDIVGHVLTFITLILHVAYYISHSIVLVIRNNKYINARQTAKERVLCCFFKKNKTSPIPATASSSRNERNDTQTDPAVRGIHLIAVKSAVAEPAKNG